MLECSYYKNYNVVDCYIEFGDEWLDFSINIPYSVGDVGMHVKSKLMNVLNAFKKGLTEQQILEHTCINVVGYRANKPTYDVRGTIGIDGVELYKNSNMYINKDELGGRNIFDHSTELLVQQFDEKRKSFQPYLCKLETMIMEYVL